MKMIFTRRAEERLQELGINSDQILSELENIGLENMLYDSYETDKRFLEREPVYSYRLRSKLNIVYSVLPDKKGIRLISIRRFD
ncbi:hypothetical protein BIY24_14510 [Halobacteriovorax marinus]|uniref:hypothetical protein n=1 Tax=Halobacteriovorax marinus TaxID=97084 RepID=UPI000BC2F72E|nr:hypothetical protein [Halobacteriovorax marinus]ATH09111.1 hypothetical protein BIY24_14510 [Halobacteriovorax marinus]